MPILVGFTVPISIKWGQSNNSEYELINVKAQNKK
jgi:hypothetical protein